MLLCTVAASGVGIGSGDGIGSSNTGIGIGVGVPHQVMLHSGRVLSVLWWALDPHRITTTCDDQTLKVREDGMR